MEINGVPLHPLVIHATVVFTPLAALLGLGYVVPRWRGALRWPMVVGVLVAMVSVQAAVFSGEQLLEARGAASPILETHEERAELLRNVMIAFTLVVLAAAALLPRRGARSGTGRASAAVVVPVSALLVVGAVAVTALVVLTGDAGAQSVWG